MRQLQYIPLKVALTLQTGYYFDFFPNSLEIKYLALLWILSNVFMSANEAITKPNLPDLPFLFAILGEKLI